MWVVGRGQGGAEVMELQIVILIVVVLPAIVTLWQMGRRPK